MAEADALDAALLLNDLLRLARPALGEGQLRLFGLVVGHALGAPPAALTGVDDEEGIGLVQAILPGQVAGQDHDAVPGILIGLLHFLDGAVHGVAYKVMWDRYTGAFVAEMQAFADAVVNDKETPVTGEDGLYPVLMAAAATKSLHEGRPVKISEIE